MRNTLVLVLAAACSSGNNPIPLAQLLSQLTQASCTSAVACELMPDVQTCIAATHFFDTDFYITTVADATAGKIKYDGNAAAACVNEIKTASCTFSGGPAPANDPCNKMFTGAAATSATCIEASECVTGDLCVFPGSCMDPTNTCCTGTMAGTCTARGQAGATCTADSECADNLYCSLTASGSGTCKAVVATAGAACDSSFASCALPLLCNLSFTMNPPTGTCGAPAKHGAACDTNAVFQCDDFRDDCDASTKTCTSRVAIGMACTAAAGNCVDDAVCDPSTSKCVASVGANQPCTVYDTNGLANCLGDTTCMSGTNLCTMGMTGCTCKLPAAGRACM